VAEKLSFSFCPIPDKDPWFTPLPLAGLSFSVTGDVSDLPSRFFSRRVTDPVAHPSLFLLPSEHFFSLFSGGVSPPTWSESLIPFNPYCIATAEFSF